MSQIEDPGYLALHAKLDELELHINGLLEANRLRRTVEGARNKPVGVGVLDAQSFVSRFFAKLKVFGPG